MTKTLNNVDICLPPLKNRTPTAETWVQHSPVNHNEPDSLEVCRQTQWEYINSAAKFQIHFNKLKVETPNNKNIFIPKNDIFKTTASKLQTVRIRNICNMTVARTLDD